MTPVLICQFQSGVELELVECQPLLEWLANNYKSFGATLEIITDKSQEGSQFVRGFGGIGGKLIPGFFNVFLPGRLVLTICKLLLKNESLSYPKEMRFVLNSSVNDGFYDSPKFGARFLSVDLNKKFQQGPR